MSNNVLMNMLQHHQYHWT